VEKTLSNQSFKMALAALEKIGVDPAPFLKEAQISHVKLMNPIGRVSIKKERHFWKIATEATSDPLLGLRLAEHVPFGAYPLLEYIGASCHSLYQALVFFSKYGQVVYGCWHPRLVESKNSIRFDLGTEGSPENSRHADEFGLALMVKRLKHFSGTDVPLKAVQFRHHLTGDIQEYKKIFLVDVSFEQEESSLLFDSSIKNIPCKSADQFLLGSLLKLAEKVFQKLPTEERFAESNLISQVTSIIGKDLALGEPQIDKIASAVGMSGRSLQRKLEEEGTTLSQLVVQVRKEVASELLKNVNLPYEEIALSLGYSTASAFNRAFKQWFKMSPSEFRKLNAS